MPNIHSPADGVAYKTVAASVTSGTLTGSGGAAVASGAGGASGDYLSYLWVVPTSTSPGAISIVDGTTSVSVFAGGASSVLDLKGFSIPVGATSVNGAWAITTGANLSVVAYGQFS